ncbi:MAG: TIGR02757 family protein [Bacteroidales bacterium]|jgi:uncharacterized protein (TIGR02757 family)|nr:TIGR02757 family protein [Bacteroidales bacterium]
MTTQEQIIRYAKQYNTPLFIAEDPVQFPHRYEQKTDIEISAFVSAWLAYGNRRSFLQVLDVLHREFALSPTKYILNQSFRHFKDDFSPLYRFYKKNDFYALCLRLNEIYTQSGDMEQDIAKRLKENSFNGVLGYFNERFADVNGIPKDTKSACKRLCMLLRWLIRDDGIVDLGIWTILQPSQLVIPLDTHVFQTARQLAIVNRRSADMVAAVEITDYLRQIFPADPSIGDFALYGLGINKGK